MNAINFIKQHGVEKAREVVAAYHGIPSYTFKEKAERGYSSCKSVDLDDLKRLVESVDLIESYGGVGLLEYQVRCLGQELSDSLKQAIADYEAVYSLDIETREFELGLAPDDQYVKSGGEHV